MHPFKKSNNRALPQNKRYRGARGALAIVADAFPLLVPVDPSLKAFVIVKHSNIILPFFTTPRPPALIAAYYAVYQST